VLPFLPARSSHPADLLFAHKLRDAIATNAEHVAVAGIPGAGQLLESAHGRQPTSSFDKRMVWSSCRGHKNGARESDRRCREFVRGSAMQSGQFVRKKEDRRDWRKRR